MAPMIPNYDALDDSRLEEVLRERTFAAGADLWVGRTDSDEWRAAYRFYGAAVRRGEEFGEGDAATGPTRRAALIGLAQIDDIGTIR
ncbi:MAG: hypothetical protein JST08_00715 [Actinobacteria bacterium]|nr:hypothetical protein [Actinomycetota bacterium]